MIGIQAIDSLRHFAGKANELQLLRDRVQELEELLGLSMPPDKLRRFKLSPTGRALLGLLYRGHNVVAGNANELQLLRDRVQELEELLGLSMPPDKLRRFKLSPTGRALLGLLYRGHNVVARASAYIAIYGARHECDQPEDKILDVHLSRIRKLLAAHQISIETHRGVGWFMTPENKERLPEMQAALRLLGRPLAVFAEAGGIPAKDRQRMLRP